MYEVVIRIPGEPDNRMKLVPGTYRVGSSPACHITFKRSGISPRHCQFIVSEDLRVFDVGGGVSVDGKHISSEPVPVLPGSKILIGDIEIEALGNPEAPQETPEENTRAAEEEVHEKLFDLPETPALAPVQSEFSGNLPPESQTAKLPPPFLPPPKPGEEVPANPPASPVVEAPAIEIAPVQTEPVQPVRQTSVFAEIEKMQPIKEPELNRNGLAKIPVLMISGIPENARPLVQEIKRLAHTELLKRLNLKRMAMAGAEQNELETKARSTIHEIVSELNIELPDGVTREKIEREMANEAIGLGPLEGLIAIPDISEIMVNGPDQIYVEHKGVLYKTDMAFADSSQVLAAIERIVTPLGRRIDESSPMVDARLKDGSRVNAIIPPLSLVGPSITIRKFSKTPLQIADLVKFGSIAPHMANFLDICVKLRKNIIISGGTGSGKTTLLNVLSSFLPNTERIVTIEDAAELQLRQEHVVRLESRPPNIEGKGEIAIRDLVRNALRMRPDRIVIGECRGGEALDMLQAMNTGHDGSLTTIHANTPRDALSRLETLVLMSGFELPLRAIREQIASAIAIIVQISREKDGSRKVTNISEITRMEGDVISMQDIFVYHQDGWTSDGKMKGRFVPTGNVPSFMEDIERAGLKLDISIFRDGMIRRGGSGL